MRKRKTFTDIETTLNKDLYIFGKCVKLSPYAKRFVCGDGFIDKSESLVPFVVETLGC